jgi:predicted Rossmann fold nucleotide-binding protein DprA/Smf involved in DNA uptake
MKLGIIGSRSFKEESVVWEAIHHFVILHVPEGTSVTIISGGAEGVDTFSKHYAKKWSLDHVEFKPYFKLDVTSPYLVRHFFVRNKQIVDNSDKILAVWNGHSTGTEHGIKYAQKTGKPVMVLKR